MRARAMSVPKNQHMRHTRYDMGHIAARPKADTTCATRFATISGRRRKYAWIWAKSYAAGSLSAPPPVGVKEGDAMVGEGRTAERESGGHCFVGQRATGATLHLA